MPYAGPHEPLREVVGEVVDSSAVVCTLPRHGAQDPLGAHPATLSNASADIAFRMPRQSSGPITLAPGLLLGRGLRGGGLFPYHLRKIASRSTW